MHPSRRFLYSLAAPLLTAVTIAAMACGGNGDGNGQGAPPTNTAEAPAEVSPTIPSPSQAPVCEGEGIEDIERTGQRQFDSPPDMVINPERGYVAEMETIKGVITVELYAGQAPVTVNSFVFLACTGYHDGLNFHRVERDPRPFVIQGGDPRGDSTGGPGYRFDDEIDPDLVHDTGVLSMANAGPGTNGSQFFITLAPAPHLNGGHTVFGRVIDGWDVVDQIERGDMVLGVSVRETSDGA